MIVNVLEGWDPLRLGWPYNLLPKPELFWKGAVINIIQGQQAKSGLAKLNGDMLSHSLKRACRIQKRAKGQT